MTNTMREKAEENDDGDLIWKETTQALVGGTSTREHNVTHLLQPGGRKTGIVEHLVIEAELYAERDKDEWGGNPAKPVDSETAKQAIEKIEMQGLTPAWRLVETPADWP